MNTQWHTHKLTPEGCATRDRYGLTDKAASLIDGLCVAVAIDVTGKALGIPAPQMEPEYRDRLGAYLGELESRAADMRDVSSEPESGR